MERFRALNRYQKGILAVLLVMTVVFTILTPIITNREGYLYHDAILMPSEQDGATVYSGRIGFQRTSFTVTDNTVVLQYGDTTYGPYTVTEDPSAVPEMDEEWMGEVTGIEVRQGEKLLFRGAVENFGENRRWLYNEDGTPSSVGIRVSSGDVVWDENGDVVDPMEPMVSDILNLVEGPVLSHKGDGLLWLLGLGICGMTAVMVLYADELFRWNLRFSIRNVENAEPSEWEIMGRYIGWTLLTLLALWAFVEGLTIIQ